MGRRIIAVICTAVSVVGIVLLGIGVKSFSDNQNEKAAYYAEFDQRLSSLERDKNDEKNAIAEIGLDVEASLDAHATASLLFCGMSERIYTEAFPTMEQYGIKGTVVMSGDRLPGGEGLLTDGQILKLTEAGWKIIPGWTEGDGDSGIASVDEWIRAYGYNVEGAVLMTADAYSEERAAAVALAGYNTVITDVGAGTEENIFTAEVGDVWTPDAMGYRTANAKTIFIGAVESKGSLIFTVGFEDEGEMYDNAKMTSMLSTMKTYIDQGTLVSTDIAAARVYRADLDERRKALTEDVESEIAAHQTRIEEIDAMIDELCKEYQ